MDTSPKKPSLRSLYEAQCLASHCRPNSQVRSMLQAIDDEAHLDPSRLFSMNLSSNLLGSKGVVPVLHTINAAKNISVIQLRDNFLSNENILLLSDLLDGHQNLVELDVGDNAISQPAGKRLLLLAKRTPSLRRLGLDATLINVALQQKIQQLLERRNTSNETSIEDSDAEHLKQQGVPLVAPSRTFESLVVVYEMIRCNDRSSETGFTTVKNMAAALLMQASRIDHSLGESGTAGVDASSVSTPRIRTSSGKVAHPSTLIDTSEYQPGTLGHALLSRTHADRKRPKSLITSNQTSHAPCIVSSLEILHIILSLPSGKFRGVDILAQAAFEDGISTGLAVDAECAALACIRCDSDVALRDPTRAALNLLLSATFGDPRPQFDQMLRSRSPCTIDGNDNGDGDTVNLPKFVPSRSDDNAYLAAPTSDAIASLTSESSFASNKERRGSQLSTKSGLSHVDHAQRLIRPTPWDSLNRLMEVSSDDMDGIRQLKDALSKVSATTSPENVSSLSAATENHHSRASSGNAVDPPSRTASQL